MVLINMTMIIFCTLFLAMIIYLMVFVSTSGVTLYNNSYNNRQELQYRYVIRGNI